MTDTAPCGPRRLAPQHLGEHVVEGDAGAGKYGSEPNVVAWDLTALGVLARFARIHALTCYDGLQASLSYKEKVGGSSPSAPTQEHWRWLAYAGAYLRATAWK